MTAPEARVILARIRYRDWEPVLGYYNAGGFWLQWVWRRDGHERKSQRWPVSNMSTKSELVQIAWQAVEAAEVYEARRQFLYHGEPIYGEVDVDLLLDLHAGLRPKNGATHKEEEKNDG